MANSALGNGWSRFLSQAFLQTILDGITKQQRLERQLVFLGRTPVTPVDNDDELVGKFEGEVFAADIVTDDQEAVVTDVGKFTSSENSIANVKHGLLFGQKQLNELKAMESRGGSAATFAAGWIRRREADLLLGIRLRLEALVVSAYRDNTVYDRYGIKVVGTWGKPADLKYVPPTPWNDHADATPIADLQFMINEVGQDLGSLFVDGTVVTLSRRAFNHMVQCDEFIRKAKVLPVTDFVLNQADVTIDSMPNANDTRMVRLAEVVAGCRFEIYESKITEKQDNGSKLKKRILPHNEILLSSPAVWNNPNVLDLGNGIVTESLVNELVGSSVVGGLPNDARGPLTYAAPTTLDLNPPGVTLWGVSRAFPRVFDVEATAMIDIGINPETGV